MKYVFFDIDNTIYSVKNNTIRKSIISLFKELKQNDFNIGIATGRNNLSLDVIEVLKEYIDYYVLSNGMYVRHKNKVIFEDKLTINDFKIVYEITKDEDFYLGGCGSSWRGFIDRTPKEFFYRGKEYKLDEINYDDIDTLWLISNNKSKLDNSINYLNSLPNFKVYKWNNGGCDIVKKNTGKETGVEKVIKYNDNKKTILISVGDGDNDVMLMKKADIKIALKTTNSKELLDISDYQITSVETDELYDLFKKLKFI